MKQQNNSTDVSPDKAHWFHDAALNSLPTLFYPETAYLGWRPKKGPHDTLAWRAAAILLHTAGMPWESIALLLIHYELTEGGESRTVLDRIRKASSDDYSRSVTSTLFPMIAHRPDGRPREPMAGIDDRNFLFAGTGRSPTVNESRTVASLPENVTRLIQLCLPSYPHGTQVDYAREGQPLIATAPALAALVVEMALLASGADGIRPGTAPVR